MNLLIWVAAIVLTSLMVGVVRIIRGPTDADRMLAAQLLGTGGVAVLLILAHALKMPSLVDVALVYALLAAIAVVVFVRRHWQEDNSEEDDKG